MYQPRADDASEELSGQGLCVAFAGAVALQNVTLSVRHGESVAVLGRNGAGKTTLVRTLVGLVKPDSGRVLRKGTEIKRAADSVASGVRFVPESGNVFPDLTVMENLYSAAPWQAKGPREQRVGDVLALLSVLERLKKRKAGQLSGGERQALAIGRALMARPQVLVLDEPTLGLAPRLAEGLMDVLARVQHDTGVAIVIAEQSAALTQMLCRHFVALDVGRVVAAE